MSEQLTIFTEARTEFIENYQKERMLNMNEQLLKQILEELQSLKTGQQSLNDKMASVESELQGTRSEMKSRFDTVDTKIAHMQNDITEIKESAHRLETDQPDDVIGLLKSMNEKLENRDNEMLAVNRRLYRVEGTLEGLVKQN